MEDGTERWGLNPARAGLGWAGMLLSSEGSTLGCTFTLALMSPLVCSDLCPIPVHWHCEVLAPAASQLDPATEHLPSPWAAPEVEWNFRAGFHPAVFIAPCIPVCLTSCHQSPQSSRKFLKLEAWERQIFSFPVRGINRSKWCIHNPGVCFTNALWWYYVSFV